MEPNLEHKRAITLALEAMPLVCLSINETIELISCKFRLNPMDGTALIGTKVTALISTLEQLPPRLINQLTYEAILDLLRWIWATPDRSIN